MIVFKPIGGQFFQLYQTENKILWWDYDDVCFILDQHPQKQKSTYKHATPFVHISLTDPNSIFSYSGMLFVKRRKQQIRPGIKPQSTKL
jgi:hypothetical protein